MTIFELQKIAREERMNASNDRRSNSNQYLNAKINENLEIAKINENLEKNTKEKQKNVLIAGVVIIVLSTVFILYYKTTKK